MLCASDSWSIAHMHEISRGSRFSTHIRKQSPLTGEHRRSERSYAEHVVLTRARTSSSQ
jgi:hypothetical protein